MMQQLNVIVIDQGNSASKITLFSGGKPIAHFRTIEPDIEILQSICANHSIHGAVYASVAAVDVRFVESLRNLLGHARLIVLTHATPLPIDIKYATPHTLGVDRIAAAVGAADLFSNKAVIVADAGTALTIDLIDAKSAFRGGNISPGIDMRLDAMHNFTKRLPKVEADGYLPEWGEDTETALRCGAVRGAVAEILQFVISVKKIENPEGIILTGGNANLLKDLLIPLTNLKVVVVDDLVAMGLLSIFLYNENF